jgi:hypothetical protein
VQACSGLCRCEGHSSVEILQACVGLGGMVQWNGDCACVDPWIGRPEGRGLVEIVNVCGLLAWQALRVQSGSDCAGLRGGSLG